MAFNQRAALANLCAMMQGASTNNIRFVLQGFLDIHAQNTRKSMAVVPRYGFEKKGNHAFQDVSRMIKAVGGADGPVCVIYSHTHCKTIVASSDPEAIFQQRQLPTGKFEIVMSMEVDHEISMATDAQSCDWIGGMQHSPFVQMHKVKDFVPRCAHCIVSSAPPSLATPKRKACIVTPQSAACAPQSTANLLPAFSSDSWADCLAPIDGWLPVDGAFGLLPGFDLDEFRAITPPGEVIICTVSAAESSPTKRGSPKRAAFSSVLQGSPKRAAFSSVSQGSPNRAHRKDVLPIRKLDMKSFL